MSITLRTRRLQLPSPPLQRVALFRDSMPPILAAASALVVFESCRVPAQVVQRPAVLGTMVLQRWRARVSLDAAGQGLWSAS